MGGETQPSANPQKVKEGKQEEVDGKDDLYTQLFEVGGSDPQGDGDATKGLESKVATEKKSESDEVVTPEENGGFDEKTWGKLDVNDWTVDTTDQDGKTIGTLTGYNGDKEHVIIPNNEDMHVDDLMIGNDVTANLVLNGARSIAVSKTKNGKVIANSSNFNSAFGGLENQSNLSKIDLNHLDVSKVTSMERIFSGCRLKNTDGISDWDISNVTHLNDAFADGELNDVSGIKNWNVSNVIDMSGIFLNNKLRDVTSLKDWKVSKGTDLSEAFAKNQLKKADLTNWDLTLASQTFLENPTDLDVIINTGIGSETATSLSKIGEDIIDDNGKRFSIIAVMLGMYNDRDGVIGTITTNDKKLIKALTGKEKNIAAERIGKRTINYSFPDGKKYEEIQSVTFDKLYKSATIANSSREIISSTINENWTPSEMEGATLNEDGSVSFNAVKIDERPGYVPVIKQGDNILNSIALVKASPNSDIVISVTYNPSTTAKFVDDDANQTQVGEDITLSGEIGQTIDPSQKMKVPENYQLAQDQSIPTSYEFKANSNDPIVVHLVHKHGTPSDNEQDKDNDNKTVHEMTHKSIKRTITITNLDGSTKDASQTVELTRTADKDLVTGKITYGNWNTSSFSKVDIPQIDGYTSQVGGSDSKEVPAVQMVDSNYIDPNVQVSYVAQGSSQTFHFITEDNKDALDKNGNKVPDAVVTGNTGDQKHGSDVPVPAGWELVAPIQDFTIPATDTAINVKIKHGTQDVTNDLDANSKMSSTKTVHYKVVENFNDQDQTVVNKSAEFHRTLTKDLVTGEITPGQWQGDNVEVKSTNVAKTGYVAQVDGADLKNNEVPAYTISSDKTDKTVTVTYTAKDAKAHISYYDDNLKKEIEHDDAEGKFDEVINFKENPEEKIAQLESEGYVFNGVERKDTTNQTINPMFMSLFATTPKFGQKKYDSDKGVINFIVHFIHDNTQIDKDHIPGKNPGEKTPIDKNKPGDHKVIKDDLDKSITRTITVIEPDGTQENKSQTLEFERTATIDAVTGEVKEYGNWTPVNGGNQYFEEFTPDHIDGYAVKIDGERNDSIPKLDLADNDITNWNDENNKHTVEYVLLSQPNSDDSPENVDDNSGQTSAPTSFDNHDGVPSTDNNSSDSAVDNSDYQKSQNEADSDKKGVTKSPVHKGTKNKVDNIKTTNSSKKSGVKTAGAVNNKNRQQILGTKVAGATELENTKSNKNNSQTLPQTGEKQSEAGLIGLALASIAGLLGLGVDRKQKN